MIKTISLSRLVSKEFYQYMYLVNGIALAANPTASKFKNKHATFAALLTRLLAALNREQAYALTKQLEKLDAERDQLIIGFSAWVKSLTKHPNSNIKAAANGLSNFLKPFGGSIASQNLQIESATITKIVDELKNNATLKAHLAALKDTEWLPALENTNNSFISLYQQRSSQMGIDANEETFMQVRKLMVNAYYELTDLINTRLKTAIEDGTDATLLQKCVNDINATIDQYKQLIASTNSRDDEGTGDKKTEPNKEA